MANQQFCETEFNKKALELFNISEICHDNFNINEKDGKFYLSKKQIISLKSRKVAQAEDNSDPSIAQCGSGDELISIEHHVLFHPSYQVPVLFFNAYKDASLIPLEDIPRIFVKDFEFRDCHDEMQNIITQAEHPILFKPFFLVHPCKVNQLLSQFTESKNFILTFLTLFGPSVQLKMSPEYDKFYAGSV